jgi:hypothetical protein
MARPPLSQTDRVSCRAVLESAGKHTRFKEVPAQKRPLYLRGALGWRSRPAMAASSYAGGKRRTGGDDEDEDEPYGMSLDIMDEGDWAEGSAGAAKRARPDGVEEDEEGVAGDPSAHLGALTTPRPLCRASS